MIQSQPLVIKISTDKTQKVATLPQMRKKESIIPVAIIKHLTKAI